MKKVIIANWKCNPTSQREALRLFGALAKGLRGGGGKEVVVCPPFVYLGLKKSAAFKLGAQDCFWQARGPFTGQMSTAMLKDLGVKYVLCGHSERRQFGETNEVANKKVRAALASGICPVLCVGESSAHRKKGQAFGVVERQIKEGLKKISKFETKKVIIAYEPIWAISPHGPCSPDEALTMALFLRKVAGKLANKQIAKSIKVLYGGSVNSQNARDYVASDFLSGLLIGAASLDAKEFVKIVKSV